MVYVVGDEWRTVPYKEVTYNGKPRALILDLGTIPAQVEVYFKGVFPTGESAVQFRTIRKYTYLYDYPNSTSVLESALWW
jgi:hypothetical protein